LPAGIPVEVEVKSSRSRSKSSVEVVLVLRKERQVLPCRSRFSKEEEALPFESRSRKSVKVEFPVRGARNGRKRREERPWASHKLRKCL
jgi:hypothetical protein